MIIQCEQCRTRFRLDDSKVTEKGVKVRCTKCKHVFTVKKEESKPESFEPSAAFAGDQQADAVRSPVPATEEPSVPFEIDDDNSESHSDDVAETLVAALSSTEGSIDTQDDFSFSSEIEEQGFAVEQDQELAPQGTVSFGDFDFEDSAADLESGLTSATPVAASVKKEELQGLDFSDDDMFGAVVQSAPEEAADAISFDFGTDSFADSMYLGNSSFGQKSSSSALEPTGEVPFSLGEIDFGDELTAVAVQQVNPDELKPSQKILFAPLAEAQEKTTQPDTLKRNLPGVPVPDQDELPPLSIASRRKQSPLLGGLVVALSLLAVGVLSYFGFLTLSSGKATVAQETGKISLRSIKSYYVKNSTNGELLVISGEAVNQYSKPRAALQVKASMFDAAGQVLVSKTAYCGNPLTEQQLISLPLDNIEAAMSNQFGDSLANLEVAPGQAVPFTIVVDDPPIEGKDFAVVPAGSTVATGKQQ